MQLKVHKNLRAIRLSGLKKMRSATALSKSQPRTHLILHAAAFVLGFTALFSIAGFSFGIVGSLVDEYRPFINLVVGLALAVFGLHMAGLFRELAFRLAGPAGPGRFDLLRRVVAGASARLAGVLYRQGQVEFSPTRSGYRSSFAVGVAFALGWTPCVGFILGGILTAAYNTESVFAAYLLLVAYSLGLGIPFLALAAFADRLQGPLAAMSRRSNLIAIISGLLLTVFGLFIAFDLVGVLSTYLLAVPFISDEFLLDSSSNIGISWLVPSFVAGLLSFLSPCVLPLAPVYLAHLTARVSADQIGAAP